jgi:hypothetical protein
MRRRVDLLVSRLGCCKPLHLPFSKRSLTMQPRILSFLVSLVLFGALATTGAWAGSPHFIFCSVTVEGNTVSVDGKEAGLGDEEQITVVVSADAQCINPGGKNPNAGNKESISTAANVPVQNGKAIFSIDLVATFQPDCSPPMTVAFSNVSVTDVTNGISCNLQ